MKLNQLTLEGLREQINLVDTLLIKCLAKRRDIAKEVARIKKANNLAIFCPEIEARVLESRKKIAESFRLDSEFVLFIFRNIMENSKKIQEEQWKLE